LENPINKKDFIQEASKHLTSNNPQKVEFWSFPEKYNKYREIFLGFFRERLERLKKVRDINSIFDIGCGYGFWLNFCNENGLYTYGIDMSEEAIDYAKNRFSLNVSVSKMEDYHFDKSFDAYTMIDILEHLEHPNIQLMKLFNLMKENDVLLIQVPNVVDLTFPLNHGYGLPFHLWQFNLKSVVKLLEKNGFKLYKYYTGIQGIIGLCEKNNYGIYNKIFFKVINYLRLGNRLILLFGKR